MKQGLTREQFQKSVDMAKFRAQMAGDNQEDGRNFDQYFVSTARSAPTAKLKRAR